MRLDTISPIGLILSCGLQLILILYLGASEHRINLIHRQVLFYIPTNLMLIYFRVVHPDLMLYLATQYPSFSLQYVNYPHE